MPINNYGKPWILTSPGGTESISATTEEAIDRLADTGEFDGWEKAYVSTPVPSIERITGTIHRDDGSTVAFTLDGEGWTQTPGGWGSALVIEAMRNALIDEDLVAAEWLKPQD